MKGTTLAPTSEHRDITVTERKPYPQTAQMTKTERGGGKERRKEERIFELFSIIKRWNLSFYFNSDIHPSKKTSNVDHYGLTSINATEIIFFKAVIYNFCFFMVSSVKNIKLLKCHKLMFPDNSVPNSWICTISLLLWMRVR